MKWEIIGAKDINMNLLNLIGEVKKDIRNGGENTGKGFLLMKSI